MRSLCIIVVLLFPAMLKAADVPSLADAQMLGKSRMSLLFWHVYDATLYTENAADFSFQNPFALKLDYLMAFSGDEIAERSAEEMRSLGFDDEVKLAAWFSQMREIFPDVQEGESLTGIYQPGKATDFYQRGERIGTVHDPEFGRWFFGIWLSPQTAKPALRHQLVGGM